MELPIHFFTIVLNGQPFIRYHIDIFKQLPFKWHWHIVEGVADHTHDTSWCAMIGGRITDELHHNGYSNDGTTEYLNELVSQNLRNITVYHKGKSGGSLTSLFWDGKISMVNAPLKNIEEECLLWEIDVDEFWTAEQICIARDMFIVHPERMAAYYRCHYFVGKNLVTTTMNTYGNFDRQDWLRTWRFKPGCHWAAHEPPKLQMPDGRNVASINPFMHNETKNKGLVFQHYAYTIRKTLTFKEIYYGYNNAVKQWLRLQQCTTFPIFLRDYFSWVKDDAQVNTIQSQDIIPIFDLKGNE